MNASSAAELACSCCQAPNFHAGAWCKAAQGPSLCGDAGTWERSPHLGPKVWRSVPDASTHGQARPLCGTSASKHSHPEQAACKHAAFGLSPTGDNASRRAHCAGKTPDVALQASAQLGCSPAVPARDLKLPDCCWQLGALGMPGLGVGGRERRDACAALAGRHRVKESQDLPSTPTHR